MRMSECVWLIGNVWLSHSHLNELQIVQTDEEIGKFQSRGMFSALCRSGRCLGYVNGRRQIRAYVPGYMTIEAGRSK